MRLSRDEVYRILAAARGDVPVTPDEQDTARRLFNELVDYLTRELQRYADVLPSISRNRPWLERSMTKTESRGHEIRNPNSLTASHQTECGGSSGRPHLCRHSDFGFSSAFGYRSSGLGVARHFGMLAA